MRADVGGIDRGSEGAVAAPAYEQPMRQRRSMMPAIAMPNPMHIDAMP
jgi:hypothetical protein